MTASYWIAGGQALLTIAMAWIGWSVRSIKACIKKDIELVGVQVADLERRMTNTENDVKEKVSDEEWIRESMKLRNDVQQMGIVLARIEGKTDSTLLVASGVNRLAEAVEKMAGDEDGKD